MRLPVRALGVGALFSLGFAYVAIVAANRGGPILPSTQISSVSILFCLILVLLLNPLLRWVRWRVFDRREVFLIFIMAIVPAGIPVFGYICEVIPLIGGLHHPEWNTSQAQWNEKVVPYLDPTLFVGAPLFQEKDVRDWQAFNAELAAGEKESAGGPAKRLWDLLPDNVRAVVRTAAQGQDYTAAEKAKALAKLKVSDAAAPAAVEPWRVEMALSELKRENRALVVRGIEHALERRDFYTDKEFAGVGLTGEAAELLAMPRAQLSLDEVERLNRYLLEAAFPRHIQASKFLADQWAVRDYVRGMQARNLEAWPVFLKKPEEDWGQFVDRIKRYCTNAPTLTANEIKKWWAFYPQLATAGTPKATPAQARIWSLLPASVRDAVTGTAATIVAANERDGRKTTSLSKSMQALLRRSDCLRPADWAGIDLPREARDLLNEGMKLIPGDALQEVDPQDEAAQQRLALRYLSASKVELFNRLVLAQVYSKEQMDDWRLLAKALEAQTQAEPGGVPGRLWALLPASIHDTVALAAKAEAQAREKQEAVLEGINAVIAQHDLYEQAAFPQAALSREARDLLQPGVGALSEDKLLVLNRELVEIAFPRSLQRYSIKFFGELPWGNWITPLAGWIILALVIYVLFYSLNELIFKQWYEREKLVFPIAQLNEMVLESDVEAGGSVLPTIFRSPLFWVGFVISFGILFYNGMVGAHWIEGLPKIDLGQSPWAFANRLKDTVFDGLRGGRGVRFHIFFTAIGLAFLLPVEISFSIWFFYLLRLLQQLVAVWLGFGVDGNSFRADWYSGTNFMMAQGGGAMEIFGLVYLWRVRRQMFAFVYRLARPQGTAGVTAEEIQEYTVPSALFFLASAGVFYFLLRGNVPLGMAILTYVALLLLTVALVRVVAECGIIGFQAWFGPFHLMKIFGLLRFTSLFAMRGIGTVMVLISGSFLDLKTFIAPTMMNAKYLAARHKISNRSFGVGLLIAITITLVVSATLAVVMAYDLSLGSMNHWFFSSFPQWTFRSIAGMMDNPEGMSSPDWPMAGWFGAGAVSCGLIMFLRQFWFWVPHPIGLVMFVNPMMGAYWFSFFVAWICKRAAVKYCDADGYKTVRCFFVGLILGEIVAIGVATVIALLGYESMGITLNRN